MTLSADDIILTGTPDGIIDVKTGDEVVCEIDGLGRLLNVIASDAEFTATDQGPPCESNI